MCLLVHRIMGLQQFMMCGWHSLIAIGPIKCAVSVGFFGEVKINKNHTYISFYNIYIYMRKCFEYTPN